MRKKLDKILQLRTEMRSEQQLYCKKKELIEENTKIIKENKR